MPRVYLTIDDGPSERFAELTAFLHARGIPAVFFNRGDCMDERPDMGVDAIRKGFVIANHTYSHRRAAQLSYEETCTDILRAESIIDTLYARAGVARTGKYFRFPYMDRGMGPCFDESNIPPEYRAAQDHLLRTGLGHTPAIPVAALVEKKNRLQQFLQREGFARLPTPGVTLPWYAQTQMAQAIDSLCTFSTADWALTARHRDRHGLSALPDLTALMDSDPGLRDESSAHILLAHDQAEIFDVVTGLVEHAQSRDFAFATPG